MDFSAFDLIVVGSGFFGATLAERCAEALGLKICVIEQRNHIGGNAWSETDPDTGIEVHTYGSHLFHTSSRNVWDYVNRFSGFSRYRHRVIVRHRDRFFTMPMNLGTLSSLFGRFLSPAEAKALIAAEVATSGIGTPRNLEEKAISLVGRTMYEAFIKGYTAKQWQTDPRELPPDIITRLPVRLTFDDFYFADDHEGLPLAGYAEIFNRMLRRAGIDIVLNTDYFAVRDRIPATTPVVFTGPIDRFFEYKAGVLGWRTLDFQREVVAVGDFQGASVINYPDADVAFTRIHEFRHLHPERSYQTERTVIFREFSRFAGRADDPYYPIDRPADKDRYDVYKTMAAAEPNVIFGGRLGSYRYLDMHQAIGAALKVFDHQIVPYVLEGRPVNKIS
ncbi:UDP-galactopyranose mutase [Rhodopila sp.]|jgi:UDP-galactopyranose mutase|uniref:UDP-galactopyranose mutase n=1 Tax=Rhodopila sp. TaxID=2480087 RepID=UPI002B5DA710|nr:UDP-galactopyranose mutase [Rhodopila sp.]HVZ07711.1 UDP-galactopyranose mutase [Rhodopila sp.]